MADTYDTEFIGWVVMDAEIQLVMFDVPRGIAERAILANEFPSRAQRGVANLLALSPDQSVNVMTAEHKRQKEKAACPHLQSTLSITSWRIEVPADADRSTTFSSEKELAKLIADWPISRRIDAWNGSRASHHSTI
jgi:hypothetical protein